MRWDRFFVVILGWRVEGGGFEVWVGGLATRSSDGGEAPFGHFVLEDRIGYGGAFVKRAESVAVEYCDDGEDSTYEEEEARQLV